MGRRTAPTPSTIALAESAALRVSLIVALTGNCNKPDGRPPTGFVTALAGRDEHESSRR